MQFAVPQFTEVEDRLIGRLTLKQFLVLLGTGGIVLFFWSILGPTIIFFALAVPIALIGIASALGRYNGRPMFAYLMPFAAFLSSTRVMVFKREVTTSIFQTEAKKPVVADKVSPESLEPAESRLKKLAYLLDSKTQEEGTIITHDDRNLLTGRVESQISMPKIELGKIVDRTREQIMATARQLDAGSLLRKSPAKSKSEAVKRVEQPAPKPVASRESEYEPTAQDTIDFTKIDEPEIIPKLESKPKPAPRTKKTSAKKFDPSSFLDPNA